MDMPATRDGATHELLDRYLQVRHLTDFLCEPLEIEDFVVQSMPDASPAKWHLAHTSWFFEALVLRTHLEGYRPLDEAYNYLFNSYYNSIGEQFTRACRGLISRPTVAQVREYRRHVDAQMSKLLTRADPECGRASTHRRGRAEPRAAAPGAAADGPQAHAVAQPAGAGLPTRTADGRGGRTRDGLASLFRGAVRDRPFGQRAW